MNTVLKTVLIGSALVAMTGISAVQAGEGRHYREYDRPHHVKPVPGHYQWRRHHDRRDYGHRHARKHYRQHRHERHQEYHPHAHGHMHSHRHERRHYHEGFGYRPHRHAAPAHVIVERRRHVHHVIVPDLPVVVGGIIGSAIANDVSNGDPAATMGGAVIGAVIGNSLRY